MRVDAPPVGARLGGFPPLVLVVAVGATDLPMTASPSESRVHSPDDALPPVEPPSAGFIVQLFLVPGVIVGLILLVWLLFSRIAQTGHDPSDYLRALQRNTPARWQAAANVADALRTKDKNQALKANVTFAAELAKILDAELASDRRAATDIQFQGFLCKALGEFNAATGLPALLKAAALPAEESTLQLRRAALEAIALLASNTESQGPLDDSQLMPTLAATAKDDQPQIRGATAFTLGVIGTPEARERIAGMLADAYPDVRFNAATGLARHGDPQAVEVLLEMLDGESDAGLKVEQAESAREYKRFMIVLNGLEAARQFHAKNPTADVSSLRQAIDRLLQGQLDQKLKIKAEEVGRLLAGETAAAAASK